MLCFSEGEIYCSKLSLELKIDNNMLTTSRRRRRKMFLAVEADEPETSLPTAVSRLYRHVTHSATNRYLRVANEHTQHNTTERVKDRVNTRRCKKIISRRDPKKKKGSS